MHYTIITELHESGGFSARCVEIPSARGYGSSQGEALARIKEAIEVVREAEKAGIREAGEALEQLQKQNKK